MSDNIKTEEYYIASIDLLGTKDLILNDTADEHLNNKGRLYLDDIFIWGSGLVKDYLLESEEAEYPRIILDEEVVNAASKHLSDFQIYTDSYGIKYLNYLKAFGGKNSSDDDKKKYGKLKWLIKFAEDNLSFWKNHI